MLLRRIAHITFAALLLISLTGLSVKRHYCMGDHVYSTLSFMGKTCMEGAMPADMPCCQNEFEHVQAVDEFQTSQHSFSLDIRFGLAFSVSDIPHISGTDKDLSPLPYQFYRPPLIKRDIPVLIQSFLI